MVLRHPRKSETSRSLTLIVLLCVFQVLEKASAALVTLGPVQQPRAEEIARVEHQAPLLQNPGHWPPKVEDTEGAAAPLSQSEVKEAAKSKSKSIAIVGAGSAGLAMLKVLLDLPENVRRGWEIVLYEEREDVGGIWYVSIIYMLPILIQYSHICLQASGRVRPSTS